MFKKIDSQKDLLRLTILSTLVFFILAHGYRFSNSMYSGDSLLMIHQNDSAWQIALGRFVQPFLVFLRGGIASPFLISALSILWISLAAYFLVDFLKIRTCISVLFVTAIMTCNTTLLATNATFLPYMDFFAFSLLLSVGGVWLLKQNKGLYTIMGILALTTSLGIYQAYICVAIGLIMLHFLFKMWECPDFKTTCTSLVKYLLSFAIAAVIYYVAWKLFQKVFGIWTANSYNGLSSVGDYSGTSFGSVIATTYEKVLYYFVHPETFTTIPFRGVSLSIFWVHIIRFCNATAILLMILIFVTKNKNCHTNWWQRIAQGFIIAVFPLGINFVCIISKGMTHTLMIYAFCLVYILAIKAADVYMPDTVEASTTRNLLLPRLGILVSLLIVCWSNIVYSNQVYLKKDLQEDAIHSLMTRIAYEIESAEGYEAGITPVAISGTFESSPALSDMEAFKDILPYGMGNTSLTYMGTDYAYLNHILNVNMNLTRISNQHETVLQMPVYPTEGSVAYVDGILVIKISE